MSGDLSSETSVISLTIYAKSKLIHINFQQEPLVSLANKVMNMMTCKIKGGQC